MFACTCHNRITLKYLREAAPTLIVLRGDVKPFLENKASVLG
jgi:hypothetical protein